MFQGDEKVAGGTIQTTTSVEAVQATDESSIDLEDNPSRVVDRWTRVQAPAMEPVNQTEST